MGSGPVPPPALAALSPWGAAAGRLPSPTSCGGWAPDGAAAPTPLGSPSWTGLFAAWRGVSGRLESLEATAASDDIASPSDEEGVTAVFLPVSVERPIRVSRLSEAGETSSSDKLLESDILKNNCFPCQLLVPHCVLGPSQQSWGFTFGCAPAQISPQPPALPGAGAGRLPSPTSCGG